MFNQYILLRNNKQSGPYNADDLSQHQLKPYDLIWIQGKSITWQTADTVEELKHILSSVKPSTITLLTPGTTSVKDDSYTTSGSSTATRIYVQLPLMINLSTCEETEFNVDTEVAKQANNHPHTMLSSQVTSVEEQRELYGYRSPEEIRIEYASWLNQQTSPRKRSAVNKSYGRSLNSAIASTLSLLWKQLRHNSQIENRVSLQPVNDVKSIG